MGRQIFFINTRGKRDQKFQTTPIEFHRAATRFFHSRLILLKFEKAQFVFKSESDNEFFFRRCPLTSSRHSFVRYFLFRVTQKLMADGQSRSINQLEMFTSTSIIFFMEN
jgi:hypothetical protein